MKQLSIPILMYHQVLPAPVTTFHKYTVTAGSFASQMRWLAFAGYVPVTLDSLLAYRNGLGVLPARPVIITFDDGFQGCVDYAVPVLQARAFTAVFYLVAGLMGRSSGWLKAERGVEFPLMDWATARQLNGAGFQCGAHTVSHPHLADLSLERCRDELIESRRQLEEQLGHRVRHLAYPYGSFNAGVRGLTAECGYASACSVRIGLSTATDDLLALHRVPVLGQDSLLDFICRLSTARPVGEVWRGRASGLAQRLQQLRGYITP